jgi:DNA-binding winged helix-turn-helix (wHTH) protein
MEYYFQDYVFNSDQLTLLEQGQLVKLRVNEAKLLALLLSDPNSVFSKDDIFSAVWSDKVVTEQVIFQNISRLRNIFENQAIINHPKKGYQWNITLIPGLGEIEPTVDTSPVYQTTENAKTNLKINSNTNTVNKYGVALLGLLLISICYFFYAINDRESQVRVDKTVLKLALIPVNQTMINNKQASIDTEIVYDLLEKELLNHSDILIKNVDEKLNYRQLQANLAFVLLDKLAEYQTDGLLLIDVSSKYGKYALSFSVKLEGFSWQGELFGHNLSHALSQLKQQLSYISSMQLSQQARITSKSINAKLVLLHQQYPEDVIILDNLIHNYLNAGQSNEASLLILRFKKLAEQQDNVNYLGRALLLETLVYLQGNYQEKARASLALASDIYNASSSVEDQVRLLNVAIYLAFLEHDYQKLKALNLEVIRHAKSIFDYGTEFSNTLYMSILAQKFENLEDKKEYFQKARAIYDQEHFVPQAEIQLDFYHFVIAREEKNEAQQIKTLQKILAISNKNKGINRFYKNEAQDILANLFISKEQFDDALGFFNFEKKLVAKEKHLLAKIYQRWGKDARAIDYAQQAYNDAIWSGEVMISLDAALLVLELSINMPDDNTTHQDTYVKYIREHYLPFWLSENKKRLIKTQLPALLDLSALDK